LIFIEFSFTTLRNMEQLQLKSVLQVLQIFNRELCNNLNYNCNFQEIHMRPHVLESTKLGLS